jgi:hypothetical protein
VGAEKVDCASKWPFFNIMLFVKYSILPSTTTGNFTQSAPYVSMDDDSEDYMNAPGTIMAQHYRLLQLIHLQQASALVHCNQEIPSRKVNLARGDSANVKFLYIWK